MDSEEVEPGFGADEEAWRNGKAARVFISCGQRSDEEKDLARAIKRKASEMGFCPYLAFEVHSSKALTEGIYDHLRTADYFLFIDFKRERLDPGEEHRGSLFSNQELSIASFLELDSLFFVEEGIKQLDGVLQYVQGNPVSFDARNLLVEKIEHEIRSAAWLPSSRSELRIERNKGQAEASIIPNPLPGHGSQGVRVRYYHLQLRNLSKRLLASDCVVQVLGIRQVGRMGVEVPDIVEMKFKHITFPTVFLPPGSVRQFDGMIIVEKKPAMAVLGVLNNSYVDSGAVIAQHTLYGPGDFEVNIVAYSREFAPAKATLLIHLGTDINSATLSIKS